PGDEDGKTGHEDTKPLRTGSGEGEEDDDLGEEVGKRSFLGWIITGLVIIALIVGGVFAYNYVSNQYYVADDDGEVSLYRGLGTPRGPIGLRRREDTTATEGGSLSSDSEDGLRAAATQVACAVRLSPQHG